MFLCGAVLTFYVLQWTVDWVWGYFSPDTLPSNWPGLKSILLGVGVVMPSG